MVALSIMEKKIKMFGYLPESLAGALESTGSGYGEKSSEMTAAFVAWSLMSVDERERYRSMASIAKRRSHRMRSTFAEEINSLRQQAGQPPINRGDDPSDEGATGPQPPSGPLPQIASQIAREATKRAGRSQGQQQLPPQARHRSA